MKNQRHNKFRNKQNTFCSFSFGLHLQFAAELIGNIFPFTPPPLIKYYVYVRGHTAPYNNALCMSQPVRKKETRDNATPLNDVVCSLSMAREKQSEWWRV